MTAINPTFRKSLRSFMLYYFEFKILAKKHPAFIWIYVDSKKSFVVMINQLGKWYKK